VDELDRLLKIHRWLEEGLTVADCRELLLTGQLARRLDLGLGEAAPQVRRRPAPKAKAPRKPDVARVAAALRKLLHQLAGPAS
jgi:DNA-binding transcriptional MerR regulator